MNTGAEQELRLIQHVKEQGYADVIFGEAAIRKELELPFCECADVVAFFPNRAAFRRIVVAESKGTQVSKAVRQLSNTVAGVLEHYGEKIDLKLLLYVPGLKVLPVGLSPGPLYLVKATSEPRLYQLLEAKTSEPLLARLRCELTSPWNRRNHSMQRFTIDVYVESPPTNR